MYLNFIFIYGHPLFRTVIRQRLFQNQVKVRVLSSGWPLNRGKENRKTLIGTTISRRQLNWGGRLSNRGFICNILLRKTSGLWWLATYKSWPLNKGSTAYNPTLYLKVRPTLNFWRRAESNVNPINWKDNEWNFHDGKRCVVRRLW